MLQSYAGANQYVSGILVKIFKKVVKNRKSARPFVMFDTDTSQREEQMKNLEIIKIIISNRTTKI